MLNRINMLRKRRGLTLQQLADATGSTPSTIAKLEKGQIKLTVEWMEKLAPVFAIEPYELLDAKAAHGLGENAEVYDPGAEGPLRTNDHYIYMRMTSDDLEEHPDGIREGTVVCFDLNDAERARIEAGAVVLVTMFDRKELNRQHGQLVGQFIAPNKVVSNRRERNWMIRLDDPTTPYDPVIRGTMRFIIRAPKT